MLTIATDDVEERWAISEDRVIYLEEKVLKLQAALQTATDRLNMPSLDSPPRSSHPSIHD
jgi:hypothetical protein